MKNGSAKNSRGKKFDNLAKAGYWMTMIILVVIGLSLAYGAPVTIAENLTIFPAFLVIFYWRYLGLASHRKDERLAKMATRAMTSSWTLTLIIVSALTTLTARYLVDLTAVQILGIIIALMASSMTAFNEYYKRKGDINW
jgi:hypothetical protein